jgi:hypothetical protein
MGAAARTPAFTGVLMLSPPREHEHFMQKHVPEAILALASWTIKRDGGKFVVAPTSSFEERKVEALRHAAGSDQRRRPQAAGGVAEAP